MEENEQHESNNIDSSSEDPSNRIAPPHPHPRANPARRAFRRFSNGVSNRLHRRISPGLLGQANDNGDDDDDYLTSNLNFDRELLFEGEGDAAAGGFHRHHSDANFDRFPRPHVVQHRRSSFDAREFNADAELAILGRNRRNSEVSAESVAEDGLERFLRDGRGPVVGDDSLGGSFLRMYFGMRDSFLIHGARVAAAPLPPPSSSDSRSSSLHSLVSAHSSEGRRAFSVDPKNVDRPSSLASRPSNSAFVDTSDASRNSSMKISEDDAKAPPADVASVTVATAYVAASAETGSSGSEDNGDEVDILNDSFSSFAICEGVQDTAILDKISKWKSIDESATTATTVNSSTTHYSNMSTSSGFLLNDSITAQYRTNDSTKLLKSPIMDNLEVVQDDNADESESEGQHQQEQEREHEPKEGYSKIGRRYSARTGKRRGYSECENDSECPFH
mmetsp:Transcript_29823/g.62732  ORF Transcript_29823/g.62732 Transcript_29823/m.62732 type:complete len:447 (+) Transcript_29823:65-1405(+)